MIDAAITLNSALDGKSPPKHGLKRKGTGLGSPGGGRRGLRYPAKGGVTVSGVQTAHIRAVGVVLKTAHDQHGAPFCACTRQGSRTAASTATGRRHRRPTNNFKAPGVLIRVYGRDAWDSQFLGSLPAGVLALDDGTVALPDLAEADFSRRTAPGPHWR